MTQPSRRGFLASVTAALAFVAAPRRRRLSERAEAAPPEPPLAPPVTAPSTASTVERPTGLARSRLILPMSSGQDVGAGCSVTVTSRPRNGVFRADCLVIGQAYGETWRVDRVTVGHRRTIVPVQHVAFEGGALTCRVDLAGCPACSPGEDFQIEVTNYAGPSRPLVCAALGDAT